MSQIIDPFGELADLFLTEGKGRKRPQGAARRAAGDGGEPSPKLAHVELLLVGHLPVRADLWLRPYADAMSRDLGAVALLRLDSEEPSVEVLGSGSLGVTTSPERSLKQTVAELVPIIDLWIVRPAIQATPGMLVQAGGARITIISSADEAALVAAYQRIKELVDASRAAGVPMPSLGIAILGSAEQVAHNMIERLNRTTRTFLGIELPLVATLRQMEASSRSQAYARFLGERSPSVDDVMHWLQEASAEPPTLLPVPELAAPLPATHRELRLASTAPQEPSVDSAPVVTNEPQPRAAPARESDAGDRDVLDLLRRAQPRVAQADDFVASPVAQATGAPPKMPVGAIKPAIVREAKPAAVPAAPSPRGEAQPLAAFVAGLTPVPVRCPGHEQIEIALDSTGKFHLLCKEDGMRDLRFVEAWTRSHRELLAMALSSFTLDPAAKAMLHVFTDKPVTLADLHGSALHLHVLTPVNVEGKTTWYAAPLNAP